MKTYDSEVKVTHFERKRRPGRYSLERLFDDIRRALPPRFEIQVFRCRFDSGGVLGRFRDMWSARRYATDINHIVGDVHFLTLFLTRGRVVLTIHDCVLLERLKGWRFHIALLFWYWLPIRRSDTVTAISEFTRTQLQRYLPTACEDVVVIPNCVSHEFQYAYKTPNLETPRLLQVGTKPNKNLLTIARALNGLACQLVIVGALDREQRHVLEENKIQFEHLINLQRDELLNEYKKADVVLFASHYEGFGLPILEAQAVGRPVIASAIPPALEVAGGAACFVDPESAKDIRAAIEKVTNTPCYYNELVDGGLANATKYRPARNARMYADLYDAAARSNS